MRRAGVWGGERLFMKMNFCQTVNLIGQTHKIYFPGKGDDKKERGILTWEVQYDKKLSQMIHKIDLFGEQAEEFIISIIWLAL